jgi:type IV secretory pathway protease TraF
MTDYPYSLFIDNKKMKFKLSLDLLLLAVNELQKVCHRAEKIQVKGNIVSEKSIQIFQKGNAIFWLNEHNQNIR